jgi:hypothetical protein
LNVACMAWIVTTTTAAAATTATTTTIYPVRWIMRFVTASCRLFNSLPKNIDP